ncbi:hypothetical protein BDY19DRAFT_924975 [Irpex rosettiformis]|uniref:Uncharacterized protein n=1 Tax=Irpex rosettiformis TaxID=378272 RepID=A0ACB8UE88_9APHY|nr:hypothetical protein BDY19DRAFT_924975 [Irpex rosettiformis]
MDLSEVTDPAGVKALLDQLRSSQAWQQTIAAASKPGSPESSHLHTEEAETRPEPEGNPASATVAALLSQLQAVSESSTPSRAYSDYDGIFHPGRAGHVSCAETTEFPAASSPGQHTADLRNCTFQLALPHISQISQDSRVADTIRNMRQEQAQLESRLWADREAIQRKHEERVQNARKKASLIGSTVTQFEADSLTDSFRRELEKFDLERVLPAWDGMLNRQQTALESLGVPTMYPTMASAEIQKQVRVLQVLESALE